MTTKRTRRRDDDVGKREEDVVCKIVKDNSNDNVQVSTKVFVEQHDLVSEIISFLGPPSILKFSRAMPFVSSHITHKHVIKSIENILRKDIYDQHNQCHRHNQHRKRHIQYHKIIVEKLIPVSEKQACVRQTPMQLLRTISGRYCERCQLDLICVSGW